MYKVPIYETSAKKNWHVDDVFKDLLQQMVARYPVDTHKKRKKKHGHQHDGDHCTLM